jgi:hypothetical protein
MPTVIAAIIAGICAAGFIAIWFRTAYKELSAKQNSLADLQKQLRLHEALYANAKDGSDVRSAANMLKTSRMLCCEAAKSYNRVLCKLMNRFPALLMGFRAADETGCLPEVQSLGRKTLRSN